MPDSLGFSVYLSTFETQWPTLAPWANTNAPVFLSLHISEEFGTDYCRRAKEICHTLADHGFRTIADVSSKTAAQFGQPDLLALAKELRLWALRIDYGFSPAEIQAMAQEMPIVLNASTTDVETAAEIMKYGKEVFAMHNFYPRPETGLDREYLRETTARLRAAGLKVMAFIPGDTQLRAPIFEGLPTLEEHRRILPSAAFADLAVNFGVDEIFLADPGLSNTERKRIETFCRDNILSIPADLTAGYEALYGQVFTCRIDSPKWLIRFEESRISFSLGRPIEPENCADRSRGCITIDNANYGRYAGEIQLIRSPVKADERVNVIGSVPENAQLLMDCIHRGRRFMLVRP